MSYYKEPFTFDAFTEGYTQITLRKCAAMDFEEVLATPAFIKWYKKNERMINRLAILTPFVAFASMGISESVLSYLLSTPNTAIMTSAPLHENLPVIPPMIPVNGGVTASFANTHGLILIHMLIIGFLTLVVSTFLRFTGRGDIIPLVAFVGGGAILYEVIGMFSDIYVAVVEFLKI